jgi:Domain of unknown function (DUF4386)
VRNRLDAIGAASGLGVIAALLATLLFTRSSPDPNEPVGAIARELGAHRDAYAASAYLGALQAVLLILFAAALARRVRRTDGDWLTIAAVGGATVAASLAIASDAALLAAAFTAHRAVPADAMLGVYGLHTWFLTSTAVPYALFVATSSASALLSRRLPRWLPWLGVAISPGLLIGGLFPLGGEQDGGLFGAIWIAAGTLSALWMAAAGISMLRRPEIRVPAPAPARG